MRLCRALLLSVVAIVFCCQCTPEQKERTLGFFFDGVPRADDPAGGPDPLQAEEDPDVELLVVKPVVQSIKHKPFEDGECETCHAGSRTGLRQNINPKQLCTKCHEDFGKEWTHWHGPVAAWACTECHSAHETMYKGLLLKPVVELCDKCHDTDTPAFTADNDAHAEKEICTLCHNPHGGGDRLLLSD